jgi:Uma2 family endonuclease
VSVTIDFVATTRIPEFELDELEGFFLLRWKNPPPFTDDDLLELFALNDGLQFEMDGDGSLIIMSPTGLKAGFRNSQLTAQLTMWANRDGTGVASDSSGEMRFPNGAARAPDAAWFSHTRLQAVSEAELERIPPVVPDFVVELRSKSDRVRRLQAKMDEYIANGVRLGWLLDPTTRTAYVYRPGVAVQVFENAVTLDASPELPGFVLDLAPIWA